MSDLLVLRVVTKLLMPFILIFALYVQFPRRLRAGREGSRPASSSARASSSTGWSSGSTRCAGRSPRISSAPASPSGC